MKYKASIRLQLQQGKNVTMEQIDDTRAALDSGDAARMSLQPRVKRRRKGAQPAT